MGGCRTQNDEIRWRNCTVQRARAKQVSRREISQSPPLFFLASHASLLNVSLPKKLPPRAPSLPTPSPRLAPSHLPSPNLSHAPTHKGNNSKSDPPLWTKFRHPTSTYPISQHQHPIFHATPTQLPNPAPQASQPKIIPASARA